MTKRCTNCSQLHIYKLQQNKANVKQNFDVKYIKSGGIFYFSKFRFYDILYIV